MQARTNINWRNSDELKLVVALAWYIKNKLNINGKRDLFQRTQEELPKISATILGVELKWDHIEQLVKRQADHFEITENILLQRADKAERYSEAAFFKSVVEDYFQGKPIVPSPNIKLADRRSFSDEEIIIAKETHGDCCYWCKAPFHDDNKPVGDHYIPYSRGGPTIQANCFPSCVKCNLEKGNMMPDTFRLKISKLGRQGRDL